MQNTAKCVCGRSDFLQSTYYRLKVRTIIEQSQQKYIEMM